MGARRRDTRARRYDPEAGGALQARRVWAKVPLRSPLDLSDQLRNAPTVVSSLCDVLQAMFLTGQVLRRSWTQMLRKIFALIVKIILVVLMSEARVVFKT